MTMPSARRALVVIMSILLIGFGLGALAGPSHAAPGSARADADTKSVTVNMEFLRRTNTSPAGNQTSYNCAVGVFVPFVDMNGYVPSEAAWLHSTGGGTPAPEAMDLIAPYSDAAVVVISGGGGASMNFNAAPGTHHQQIGGFTFAQSPSPPNECLEEYDRYVASYSHTATVTYVRSEQCQAAGEKLDKAQKAVSKAQQAVAGTQGVAHTRALARLKAAKAKLAKAKKKYRKACK